MTDLLGNDLSHWNPATSWAAAAAASGFEMLKATQGVWQVDAQYPAAIAALRSLNEPRGTYHYPDAGDPIAEAEFYVQHAGRREGELQALDFEGLVDQVADPVGWAAAFLGRVITLTDNIPLIYMSHAVVVEHDWARVVALNVGLWCAAWNPTLPTPGQWPFVVMWQTSDSGHLAGVDGKVDTDRFLGDAATWARYGANRHAGGFPHPLPPPVHPPAGDPGRFHIVAAGDTLSGIAAATGTTVAGLVALNRRSYPSLVANPNHIEIGWHIVYSGSPVPRPRPPAPAPANHRVVAGDTLGAIAAANRTSIGVLMALNPFIRNPDHIEVGWTLRLR